MQRVQQRSALYLTAAGVLVFISFLLFEVYFTSPSAWVRMSFGLVSQVIRSGLLIVWCVSIHNRILNKQIRQYLLWVGALMLLWLNVRFIKWDFLHYTDPLGRYIWYAFYIPMLVIPLLGVFIIQCVDKPENYVLPQKMKLLYIPLVLLLVLIFTNDLHELVFVFPNGITNYNFDYGYNFGFYIVCAWFVILGFYFVIMLSGVVFSISILQQLPSFRIIRYAGCNSLLYFAFHGKPKRLLTVLITRILPVVEQDWRIGLLFSVIELIILTYILIIPCEIIHRFFPVLLGKKRN